MSWWIWVLIAIGCYLVWAHFSGKEMQRRSNEEFEARLRERRRTEEYQRESEKRAEEERRARLDAATLYGEIGESIDDAAKRLGVTFKADGRHRKEKGWFGRRGNDAYRAVLTDGRPAFYVLPTDEEMSPPLGNGRLVDDLGILGWKLIEHTTVDKPYNCRAYDEDTFYECIIAVDRLGRIMRLLDNGNATWESSWDSETRTSVGKWKD